MLADNGRWGGSNIAKLGHTETGTYWLDTDGDGAEVAFEVTPQGCEGFKFEN